MSVILKQFDGGAISPRDDAILYNSIIQRNGIFNGCEITHLGANQLKITAGRGIIKGRTFEIEEMTVNCQLASYGTQKGRMYLRMELSNLETPIQIKTVAATSLPELVQEEDCNYTNGVYEMELCTYNVTDVLISELKMTYDAIDTAFPIARSLEEAEGVTDPDVLANALSVGQLSRDLQNYTELIPEEIETPISNSGIINLSESLRDFKRIDVSLQAMDKTQTIVQTFYPSDINFLKLPEYNGVCYTSIYISNDKNLYFFLKLLSENSVEVNIQSIGWATEGVLSIKGYR